MALEWAQIWLEMLGPCLTHFGESMIRAGMEAEQIKMVIICDLGSLWCSHKCENIFVDNSVLKDTLHKHWLSALYILGSRDFELEMSNWRSVRLLDSH